MIYSCQNFYFKNFLFVCLGITAVIWWTGIVSGSVTNFSVTSSQIVVN